MTGFGIAASFIRHRVQPLRQRERYFFEYQGGQDSCRMVPGDDLHDGAVLKRLQELFEDVVVVPPRFDEYCASRSSPAVIIVE